ncbi:hypothetical protein D9M68_992380 [compost metagenome]
MYPAAGLVGYVGDEVPKFVVDPHTPDYRFKVKNTELIQATAAVGLPPLAERLKAEFL